MAKEKLDEAVIDSLAEVLGDTHSGFTGSEIGQLLEQCSIVDVIPSKTKRIRLAEALKGKQRSDGCANNVLAFVIHAMNPVKHHDAAEWYEDTRVKLNKVLAFIGLQLQQDGKLIGVTKAETHSEAAARASNLKSKLLERNVHPDVLRFCKEELLVANYFHAVFEATKSVAEKIRVLTGLTSDGSTLVDEAFSFRNAIPCLAFNSLQTDSEKSEQRGFMNLLKGLFGTFRNTTAHAPRITWPIAEQDALDILSLVSLVHRRLDTAIPARSVCSGNPS